MDACINPVISMNSDEDMRYTGSVITCWVEREILWLAGAVASVTCGAV